MDFSAPFFRLETHWIIRRQQVILTSIFLNPQLLATHQRVLLQYFQDEERLTYSSWTTLFRAVDLLSNSVIFLDRKRQTFRQFYNQYIDRRFAGTFINQLIVLDNLEREAHRLRASISQDIIRFLEQINGFTSDDEGCRMLMIYCLYWWSAFARGYIFELMVFRDMEVSGIKFTGHDISNSAERFSPYDFIVLSLRGDVKYSTYFLSFEQLSEMASELFITRWYLGRRRWLWVVLLREYAWEIINGNAIPSSIDDVRRILPNVAEIHIDNIKLIVLEYNQWKQKVFHIQHQRRIDNND